MREPGPIPPEAQRHISQVDLLLLLMTVIWGANFAVIKAALEDFHPLSFNAIRFIVASTLLAIATRGHGSSRKLERKDFIQLVFLGTLANCVYQVLFIHGINLTRAGNTALILGATPVFTALLSAWRGHERLGPRSLLGITASFLGVMLIVISSHHTIGFSGTFVGDLLVFSCTLLWPIYSVGLRPLMVKYGNIECTRITMVSGTIPLVLLAIPSLLNQSWDTIHLAAWGGLLYSAAGAIALCYSIWNYAVRRVGNTHTSAYSNLTPVITLLVAWVFLGERPLIGQLVGMGAIFAGIYLTRLDRKPEELSGAGV
jgi:drug/metabolite transporter (DMT)-like permease